ncbi:MAG: hypothetical protein AB7V62_15850 [Thermoleophilia bacterium]
MAKRKKRKGAGPQPVGVKKTGAVSTQEASARPAAPKRLPGEPVQVSFKGVLIRAGIVAAIFYPYLVYVVGEEPGPAALIALLAFGLMVPLGVAIDRFRYNRQMKRWNERRARQSGS